MKKLFMTLPLLIASQTFAGTHLREGDVQVDFISHGEITAIENVYPDCPPNALCLPAGKITVRVPLNGCADTLGPVSYDVSYNEASEKYDLRVAAINIANEMSMRIRCIKIPEADITVYTKPFLSADDIELRFMK